MVGPALHKIKKKKLFFLQVEQLQMPFQFSAQAQDAEKAAVNFQLMNDSDSQYQPVKSLSI